MKPGILPQRMADSKVDPARGSPEMKWILAFIGVSNPY
jgi:hypothetical protein